VQLLVLPQIQQRLTHPEHCVPWRKKTLLGWTDHPAPRLLRNEDLCSPEQQQRHDASQSLSGVPHHDEDEYRQTFEVFAVADLGIRCKTTFTLYEQI
jgi:hypothetical protein